jgi:hypothetical protein
MPRGRLLQRRESLLEWIWRFQHDPHATSRHIRRQLQRHGTEGGGDQERGGEEGGGDAHEGGSGA